MTRKNVLALIYLLLIYLWFISDIQANSFLLSCATISIVATGILQVTSVLLQMFERNLQPVDQAWLILARRKFNILLYIVSTLSILVCADLLIALPNAKESTRSATRVYCRETSNVPGRVSSDLLVYKGKMCFKIADKTGAILYVPESNVFRGVLLGDFVTLSMGTIDSLLFGHDAYLMNPRIEK